MPSPTEDEILNNLENTQAAIGYLDDLELCLLAIKHLADVDKGYLRTLRKELEQLEAYLNGLYSYEDCD